DARRPRAARDGDGRAAAAVEHLCRRHELRGPAAAPAWRVGDARRRARRTARRDSRLPRAAPRATRAHRAHAGLRRARYLARQQIQTRSLVPETRVLLARSETDRAVVLDYRPRRMGSARAE